MTTVPPTIVNMYVIGRGHSGKSTVLNNLYRRLTQLNVDPYPVMTESARGTVFLRVIPLAVPTYKMTLRLCDTAGLMFSKTTIANDMKIVRKVREGLKDNEDLLASDISKLPPVPANEAHAFLIIMRADELKWVSNPKYKQKVLEEQDMVFLGSLREECQFLANKTPALILTCCDLAHEKRSVIQQKALGLGYTKALFLTGLCKTKTGALELDEASKPDVDALIRWITQPVLESVKKYNAIKAATAQQIPPQVNVAPQQNSPQVKVVQQTPPQVKQPGANPQTQPSGAYSVPPNQGAQSRNNNQYPVNPPTTQYPPMQYPSRPPYPQGPPYLHN